MAQQDYEQMMSNLMNNQGETDAPADDPINKSGMTSDPQWSIDKFIEAEANGLKTKTGKQDGNFLESFLTGIGKTAGAIGKVGLAIAAPSAVNAYYDEKEEQANKKMERLATEIMMSNQGEIGDANDLLRAMRATDEESFKRADFTKVSTAVGKVMQPIVNFNADKIQSNKQGEDLQVQAFVSGRKLADENTGIVHYDPKISGSDIVDFLASKNLEAYPVIGANGTTYTLSPQSKKMMSENPTLLNELYGFARKNKVSDRILARAFNLPPYDINAERSLDIRQQDADTRKARLEAKPSGMNSNQWLAWLKWAGEQKRNDQSGVLEDAKIEDIANAAISGSPISGVKLPSNLDLIKARDYVADANKRVIEAQKIIADSKGDLPQALIGSDGNFNSSFFKEWALTVDEDTMLKGIGVFNKLNQAAVSESKTAKPIKAAVGNSDIPITPEQLKQYTPEQIKQAEAAGTIKKLKNGSYVKVVK